MSIHCRRAGLVALTVLASASTAGAAGIERVAPSTRILFEEGSYLEFAFNYVDPDLDGEGGRVEVSPGVVYPIAGSTGDIFDSFKTFGAAFKTDVTDRVSYAISIDEPYGVRTEYPEGFYDATSASIDATTLTAALSFDATPGIKLYGGVRAQHMEAQGSVPFAGSYDVETDSDIGFGFMAGAAYQRPALAQRVALTYYSPIEHDFDTLEFGAMSSSLHVETPQQVSLEFQSGVSPTTLLFGSIRWVDWKDFVIDPTFYPPDQPIAEYQENTTTYTLGLGRQLTERISAAAQVSYEPSSGTVLTTLGPVDGSTLVSGALKYDRDDYSITGSLTHGWLGGAVNELGTRFDDGKVWALGLRLGYRF